MPRRRESAGRLLTALVVALCVRAAPAFAQAALLAGPPGAEVFLEADSLTYGWDREQVLLDGHVVARRGEGSLRAARATLDRRRGLLTLSGGVLGVQGREVFLADGAVVDLNARTAELGAAVLLLKEGAADPAAPRSGRNALTLHAARLHQLAEGGFSAEEVRLTPCDCVGEPDYELLAARARVHGDRAELEGAQLRLLGATLPLFPLSLPLTQRQSGLLAPQIRYAALSGLGFAQPVFVTLGESADLTVSPGFFLFGRDAKKDPAALGNRAIRGPRLGLELRYAPLAGTSGSLAFDLFQDLDQGQSAGGRGLGGLRGIAHLAHRSEGAAGTLALQGTLATDVLALSDAEPATLDRFLDSLRTDLGAWRQAGALTYGADATLLQDLRLTDGTQPDRRLYGAEAQATFQRLPALFAQVAPVPVGFATLSAEASAAQFLAFRQPDFLERTTGFAPTDRRVGAPAALADRDLSRAPALRLDLAPRLAFAGPDELPVELRFELGGRADGWLVEGNPARNQARAYGLAGLRAALPLERAFGGALHRLEPALEVRALSRSLRSGADPFGDPADAGGPVYFPSPDASEQGLPPGAPRRDAGGAPGGVTEGTPASRRGYDELDGAAPSPGAVEATLSLSQALWLRSGRSVSRLLRFDLLQDALLWSGGGRARLGEGSAVLGFQRGPFALAATARYDWAARALTTVSASGSAADARGDEVHASTWLLTGASERFRAGVDELFAAVRLAAAPAPLIGVGSAGLSVPLPRYLRASYDLSRNLGTLRADQADWSHRLSAGIETPCRCAAVSLAVAVPLKDGHLLRAPSFAFLLDLKNLGSLSTF